MSRGQHHLGSVLIVALGWTAAGCGVELNEQPAANQPAATAPPADSAPSAVTTTTPQPRTANRAQQPAVNTKTDEPQAPPPLEMPVPKLSQTHAASCLVQIGELFPAGRLATVEGGQAEWGDLLGEQATVVFCWSSSRLHSLPILADMGPDVLDVYGDRGVRVIGINVGDPGVVAVGHLTEAEAKFPNLHDADGSYFARLATDGLPRIYLLDGQGKLLWFDIEYSRDTRRQLDEAIRYTLGER